jgi:hypothetical protein
VQEQRRHKRYSVDISTVSGRLMFASDVKILDISIGGISLKADKRLNMGSEYLLKLEGKGKLLRVKGLVVWSSLSGSREIPGGEAVPIYTAGMRFSKISTEKIAEILDFVEYHKKEEAHQVSGLRTNVRFHISGPEKAVLQYPENYKVKEVSLSGMRIECSCPLGVEVRLPMELSLQDDVPITFFGRVVMCQDAGEGRYAIGIEFLDLKDRDKGVLSAFIDYCAAREIEGASEVSPAAEAPADDLPQELMERIEHLHGWHSTMGYYTLLGVKEYASDRQIRHAYTALAKEFHPDSYAGISAELKGKLNEIFKSLSIAYATLKDPEKRREYDRMWGTRRK